ncbi:MAG: hypothetical protein FJW24_11635 [Acidimicrobiia bacterium]|nr:hypothetical protein [Acidimicrobiia bacterium]
MANFMHRVCPETGLKVCRHAEALIKINALVSVWEDDGALVVYDAATFAEFKRLAMRKPSGKYNVHNKITRSAGTSH